MPNLPKPKRRSYLPERKKRTPTSDQKLYNSTKWRNIRKQFARKYGFICQACKFAGIDTPESYVCDTDHIIPVSMGGDPYDERNLNRLCSRGESHHHKKSAIEGKTNAPLVESVKNENGFSIPKDKVKLWEILAK